MNEAKIKIRIGGRDGVILDLCKHLQLPCVSYNWNGPEYTLTLPIKCKICNKTFIVNIGVN